MSIIMSLPTDIKEIWIPIRGYEQLYSVSNHGRVRSHDRVVVTQLNRVLTISGRIMKCQNSKKSKCLNVCLCSGGKRSQRKVRRLVAEAFLNIDYFDTTYYIINPDNDYTNCCLLNIAAVRVDEFDVRLVRNKKPDCKKLKPVTMTNTLTGEKKNYRSITEAAEAAGVAFVTMSARLKSGRVYNNTRWQYTNTIEESL